MDCTGPEEVLFTTRDHFQTRHLATSQIEDYSNYQNTHFAVTTPRWLNPNEHRRARSIKIVTSVFSSRTVYEPKKCKHESNKKSGPHFCEPPKNPATTYFRAVLHYHRPLELNGRVRNGNVCFLKCRITGYLLHTTQQRKLDIRQRTVNQSGQVFVH